ncbi:MAG TPA: TaqI-like C-terminal specificity domain-containing protein [Pyrinomonadaceae bacterium]|nr:TaqI-like C-terminal specificity domain-containing protein [Pyrinomonadaceae bacterium]
MNSRAELPAASDYPLQQRWPDPALSAAFRELLRLYEKVVARRLERSGDPQRAVGESYRLVCRWVRESGPARGAPPAGGVRGPERAHFAQLLARLREAHGEDWLQSVASLLGMLMHLSAGEAGGGPLSNTRRPKKLVSTYPNSPALARFVGDAAIARLLRHPAPARCRSTADAERYAERALNFRVLDPSMESGQLLLAVAAACVRRVAERHAPGSADGRRLTRAVLAKLYRDCLWGSDRNGLAVEATRTVLSLLCDEVGAGGCAPAARLSCADALAVLPRDSGPPFDCVVNNPPWGEALGPEERARLRRHFPTFDRRGDTYVAFSERALNWLRPGGVFVLVLPSQVVGASNAARLREFLAGAATLDELVLLPRAVFSEATVRAVVLLGGRRPAPAAARCRVTFYPLVKRLGAPQPAVSVTVASAALREAGTDALSLLVRSAAGPRRLGGGCVRLGQVASVACGVQVYGVGRGLPPQTAETVRNKSFTYAGPTAGTVPAVRGRDVRDFCVGEPRLFIKFGDFLAWAGRHESLRGRTRVFLRELCHRGGKMTAAVARDGYVPLHGVLTVVPELIDAHVLTAILNSAAAAEYVRHHTASFTKVDFQKITVAELRRMPIPTAAIAAGCRKRLGLAPSTRAASALRRSLAGAASRLARSGRPDAAAARRLRERVDALVAEMYRLSEENSHA